MKSAFGQYGKLAILFIALSILLLIFSPTNEHSFYRIVQKNATPKAAYGKEDSEALVDHIAIRKKPVITIRKAKLKDGNFYYFIDYASVSFHDTNAIDQKLYVLKITTPSGDVITNEGTLSSPIRVERGTYTVTYRAQEIYRGVTTFCDKSAKFLVD